MSKALKCDRCGVCFDPLSGNGPRISVKSAAMYNSQTTREHKYMSLWEDIDLCPKCTEEFNDWYYVEAKKDPDEYEDWKVQLEEKFKNGTV